MNKIYLNIHKNINLLQFVSPTQSAHIYSEKVVHLPHCYFVNDYKQVKV